MKKISLAIGLIIFLLILTYLILPKKAIAPKEAADAFLKINNVSIEIEIADEQAEQEQGLSGRTSIPENAGMLLVFPEPSRHGIWMKDMHFSIDILWINSEDKIIYITKNLSPSTYPEIFYPPSPIKYILELNAGWAERNNIKVEDLVKF